MRFIWTHKAMSAWVIGQADPRHTISAPNIGDIYHGFVDQLRKGTPWMLVNEQGEIVDTGTAGFNPRDEHGRPYIVA